MTLAVAGWLWLAGSGWLGGRLLHSNPGGVHPSFLFFLCVSIHLSVHLSIYLWLCLSMNDKLSFYLSICLVVNLSLYLPLYLFVCLPIYLSP